MANLLQHGVAYIHTRKTENLGFLMFSEGIDKQDQAVDGLKWFEGNFVRL